nr:hypothetical protein [Tanacetum cinerariifolium]
ISIVIVNTYVSHGYSGNTTRIMRRNLMILLVFTKCIDLREKRNTNPSRDLEWLRRVVQRITSGGGGGGSVDVVLVVAVKLEGTSANAVRALKKFVLCIVSTEI